MQSGLGRPAAGARPAGICSQWARAGALLLSLAASACANVGQLGNLTEERRIAVAIESVDGPPPDIFRRFMTVLKEEAGTRQISVVTSGEADYRLRGYLATRAEADGTAIAWAWDAYDSSQRRALRMGGVERARGDERNKWAGADDQMLRKIARSGVERFAAFAASNNRPQPAAVASAPPPPPERSRSTFAWLDDWAPEASGIFRIFRREEPRTDASVEADRPQSRDVPLPKGRPEPSDAPSATPADTTLAFASHER